MIYEINFSDDNFKSAQKFNSKMAKKFGADVVIEYGPENIDAMFKEKNEAIWNNKRGCGYWIWKPYITQKTLKNINEGDCLLYMDSGACVMDDIHILTDIMVRDNIDIMLFCLHSLEKYYSKRDAFVLLDCDKSEFAETPQRCASYFLLRKSDKSVQFVNEWLDYAQDKRIITNEDNVMGLPNYEGFVENRHDQTILSLLSKKWGIQPYRDPGRFGLDMKYDQAVLDRSPYLQIFDDHRNKYMPKSYFVYRHVSRRRFEAWHRIIHRTT